MDIRQDFSELFINISWGSLFGPPGMLTGSIFTAYRNAYPSVVLAKEILSVYAFFRASIRLCVGLLVKRVYCFKTKEA